MASNHYPEGKSLKRDFFETVDFYSKLPKKYQSKQRKYPNFEKIRLSIPNRISIIGSSGSGKSNTLLNLITGMNCFDKIYLFVKNPQEPLYNFFISEIREIEEKMEVDLLTVSTELTDLPEVDEFDASLNNLVVFDDMISESSMKLKKVQDLWIRGRKHNITTIFLSQSFYKIPLLVRQNTDVIILKKIGTKRDLSMILSEYSNLGLDMNTLKALYKYCDTTNIKNFFMIDMSIGQDPEYLFRKNFSPIPLQQETVEY